MFNSVDEFIELADAYFKKNDGGKISWTGLCLAVGAESRQSLDRYKNGEHGKEFVGPIKKALMRVENYYEESTDGAKSIFILKNFDWRDKQEVEHTGDAFKNTTNEELDNKINSKLALLNADSNKNS